MERRPTTNPRDIQPSGRNANEEFQDQKNSIKSIMRDAKGRIGIFPILAKDIKYFGTITTDENMDKIDNNMLFFNPKY